MILFLCVTRVDSFVHFIVRFFLKIYRAFYTTKMHDKSNFTLIRYRMLSFNIVLNFILYIESGNDTNLEY